MFQVIFGAIVPREEL